MRVILITLGSYGDLYPFIWMGKVLQQNGHDISFLANSFFESPVNQAGLDFHSIGTVEDYELATTPAALTNNKFQNIGASIQASHRLFNYLFLKPMTTTYQTILELKTTDTVILNHFYAYGAKLAAEKTGIPNFNINLAPYWLRSFRKSNSMATIIENQLVKANTRFIDKQLFLKPVNTFRKEIDLEPLRESSIEWMFSGMNLCLFPDWLMNFPVNENINLNYLGFPNYQTTGASLNKELTDFLKLHQKPLVFTPGTACRNAANFFKEATLVLEKLGRPGIFLSKYSEIIPAGLPTSIIYQPFAPLELLLKECSLLVHHGGIGTCYQAMQAGIPQVICYRMAEQKNNALLLKDLGVSEALPFETISQSLLLQSIQRVTNNNNIAGKCQEIAAKLAGESTAAKLVKAVESQQRNIREGKR